MELELDCSSCFWTFRVWTGRVGGSAGTGCWLSRKCNLSLSDGGAPWLLGSEAGSTTVTAGSSLPTGPKETAWGTKFEVLAGGVEVAGPEAAKWAVEVLGATFCGLGIEISENSIKN